MRHNFTALIFPAFVVRIHQFLLKIMNLTPENIPEFLDSFDTFLLDCDGVIWSGNKLINDSNVTISMLKSLGKRIVYVTNNASKSRSDLLVKLKVMGIDAGLDDVFGSGT